MNGKYTIAIAVVVLAVIFGSVAAYVYVGADSVINKNQPTPTPTAVPTASPTTAPTNSPTGNPTAHPTGLPTPTPSPTATPTPSPATLNGAGATFPYPLLNAMINNHTTAKPWVQVNYQPIGSGGGIKAYTQGQITVDFAASDAPLTSSDAASIPNALHIPETIGAVTVAYNVPGVATGLHLTGQVIADIYQGIVTKWNDPEIQNLNPTLTLPPNNIIVVHRSDSSGTSFVFTGYLTASSSSWASAIGQGKTVAWPVGIASLQNAGVAAVVQGQANSLGYVELAYALQNNMAVAAIQNPAGNWVMPTLETTTAAAQSVASVGLPAGSEPWTNVNILNAQDANAYPIVTFSYLIVYKELNVVPGMTQNDATALVQFLWYIVHSGQDQAPALAYASLPSNVVQIDEATIKSITFNGQVVYS